jgi:serine O-acetyltransferase
MAAPPGGTWNRFSSLVFSDLQRYRPGEASWIKVAIRCTTLPGMIASVILRAQQCLWDSGRTKSAMSLRTVGLTLLGMDILPGMEVGPGLLLAHPGGVTIGTRGLTIGANVTFAGGVTCAARYPDPDLEYQELATIGDGAVLGAHSVLVGPVKIGRNAMVGSNSVVLSDVPDNAVVFGVPARRVGTRDDERDITTDGIEGVDGAAGAPAAS